MLRRNFFLNKKLVIIVLAILLFGISFYWLVLHDNAPKSPTQTIVKANNPEVQSAVPVIDKAKYSTTDPASPWVVVNKQRPLPRTYIPTNLVTPNILLSEVTNSENMHISNVMNDALSKLVAGAKQSEYSLMLVSGYRSYTTQSSVYNGYVKQDGQIKADTYSAQPGHSEHQTGLAVDLGRSDRKCQLESCFGDLPEGKWLAANAYEYGFIIRYTKNKQQITGYSYEPWHLRYVGTELSREIYRNNIETLEEFFGLQLYSPRKTNSRLFESPSLAQNRLSSFNVSKDMSLSEKSVFGSKIIASKTHEFVLRGL